MISLDSPYLEQKENKYISHAAEILLENNYYAQLTANQLPADTVSLVVENPSGTIALPDDWVGVTVVSVNGQLYTLTENPESPSTGEFLYNPFTNTVEVFTNQPVRSVVVYGQLQTVDYFPSLLPQPYPALFSRLPLIGAVQINRQFEEHPSAQFEFQVALPKSFLQVLLTPGKELNLYGIAFRINNCQIVEESRSIHPERLCTVSVSLGSKWENYLNEVCFLLSNGRNQLPLNEPFQDPDCVNEVAQERDINKKTTVPNLLSKIRIPYIGVRLKDVEIPENTPRDAVANPVQLLQERLRTAQSFVRWSNSAGVEVINYKSAQSWVYPESKIRSSVSTNYDAISKVNKNSFGSFSNINRQPPNLNNFPINISSPNLQVSSGSNIALGFEYPNSELTGKFAEPKKKDSEKEKNQDTRPRYVKLDLKRKTRVEGDKNAHLPLEGVLLIQTMSLCFDLGGQTKSRTFVTEEAGSVVQTIDETWGFAFTAIQIYDDSRGNFEIPYAGDISNWQCLRKIITTYTYDPDFGYLISTNVSGYNTVRYLQESPNAPETIELESDDLEFTLYNFFRLPISGGSSKFLKLMPDRNDGLEDIVDIFKVCNRDGSSSLDFVRNPNYAPPYYVEFESSETVGYCRAPNPENEGLDITEGDKLLPDLIVGEESRYEAYTTVTPAKYELRLAEFSGGFPVYQQGQLISPQKFTKFIKKFNAQDQAIASAVEETYTEEGEGELPLAPRRPPLFTREEPDNPDVKNEEEEDEQLYRHLIQTPGYSASDPINGSESFPLADTFDEALNAASCKLAIENWRNGFSESLEIDGNLQIKEGDKFNYYCNGEYRQRVVISASTTLEILGTVGLDRKITAKTSLILGNYVLPNLTFTRIKLPKEPKPTEINFAIFNIVDETIGSIIDWGNIQSRRNPLGGS